jgi:flagellar biosynthesis protein FlhA
MWKKWSRSANDWAVPAAAVALVLVMLIPLPAFLLDLLLAASITGGMLVLLSALSINRPVQFSVFPSLLLLLTLFRLSLNLASSRRILLHGNEGASAAGAVIQAFGQFVVGGNYVVGFVLFIALIAIQYMVVSHGAVRTAEVTARFTLDALPGKQMAIDADMHAGVIDEAEARKRRQLIAAESEFYGAMDGAARFSQRDALATILITAINIVAGFLIGVFQQGIPFMDALKTYTVLTVGDGLVTMIPSLFVSMAGGIVVTRTASEDSLGSQLGKQLFSKSKTLWIAGGIMLSLALIPGLPKFPFFLASAVCGLMAWRLDNPKADAEATAAAAAAGAPGSAGAAKAAGQESPDSLIKLDELSLEVGYALVPLVDEKKGGQLLQRIRALRRHLATELGFVVPSVHITDNIRLKPREYVISLRGVEIGRWEMHGDSLLAIASDTSATPLDGLNTTEPAFGASAKWITPAQQDSALATGWIVVDQTSALATHISELIKQFAHEVLTRQETKRLLDAINDTHPKLVEELIPKQMSLGEVQKVLQQLLREHVSIRDLGTILETLVDTSASNKNPVALVEAVRHNLARSLVHPLLDPEGKLKLVSLDASIAEEVNRAFSGANVIQQVALEPSLLRRMVDGLRNLVGENFAIATPVLLCASPARYYLRRLLEPVLPKVVVLSPGEIPPRVRVELVGSVQ